MSPDGLIGQLRSRGIRLMPEGDRLMVEPASLLTDADRAAIRAFKPELLAALRNAGAGISTAENLLRATLQRIEMAADGQAQQVRDRIGNLLAEFGPAIQSSFVQDDPGLVGQVLAQLEAEVSNIESRC